MNDRASETADTVDIESTEQFDEKFFSSSTPDLQFTFGGATHVGNVRASNDDHFAIVRRRRSSELVLSDIAEADLPLAEDSAYGIIVADGIGGSRFGELASRLAIQTMFELAGQATSWVTKFTDMQAQQIQQRVDAYVKRMQSTLRESMNADPALAGMGTTWTSAHLMPPYALIVHIGDSRAYKLRDGNLRRITRDDTMAQALIDAGISPDNVRKLGNILLNSLGGETDDVTAQVRQIYLQPGDRLLVCTDGLTDMVTDRQIESMLQSHADPQAACDALINAALAAGGKDNVTVALAAVAHKEVRRQSQ